MTSKRWIRSAIGIAALGVAAVGVIPPTVPGAPSVSAATDLGAGGEYHSFQGKRIFDSRVEVPINDPAPGPKPTGAQVHVPVLGKADVPANADDVLAVAVTVTIVRPTVNGFAEVYPKGPYPSNPPSLINFRAGADVPNMVIVGVGDDGSITVLPKKYTGAEGTVDVLVDVFGWVSKSSPNVEAGGGARLISLDTPFRAIDSRTTSGGPGPIGPQQTLELQIRGSSTVPNDPDVTGVVVNLTTVNTLPSSANTFLSLTGETSPSPLGPPTSNANVRRGVVKANLTFVPVGADGKIRIYNSAGDADVIVDVFGYLIKNRPEVTYEGRIIPLEFPFRAFDTRQIDFGGVPLGFGEQEDWSFWCFADSITVNGQSVNKQSALLGNVTGTLFDRIRPDLSNDTFLKLYPRQANQPITSNINMYPNTDIPNMALLTYGDSDPLSDFGDAVDPYMVRAYNQNGTLHYILDVFAIVLSEDPAPPTPAGYCDTNVT